jgi:EpsI family protein
MTNSTGGSRSRRNSMILVGVMLAFGVAILGFRPLESFRESESVIRGHVPLEFGDWHGTPDADMGQDVYRMLTPDGIVFRDYSNSAGERMNFVLLVGSHAGAFHDPTVCFSAQALDIVADKVTSLKLDTWPEPVPVRLQVLRSTKDRTKGLTAIYWWRTPMGRFVADPSKLWMDAQVSKILGRTDRRGFFFRVLVSDSLGEAKDLERMRLFSSAVVGELKKSFPASVGLD